MALYVIRFVMLTAVFSGIYRCYSWLCRLPEASYRSPVLALEILRRPLQILIVVGPAVPAWCFWNVLGWDRIDPSFCVRPVVWSFSAFIVASQLFASCNCYFRRRYIVDRIILCLLGAATIAHPGFVFVTVGFGLLLAGQIAFPLIPWISVADFLRHKVPYFYYLIMFEAWLYGVIALGSDSRSLVTLLLAGFAGTYVWSAIGKMRLSWLANSELVGVLNTAVAHQKWRNQSGRWFRFVHESLVRFRSQLLIGTLVLEAGACLLCVRWELTLFLLLALAVFQLIVSQVSGINFRSWVVVSGLMCLMVIRLRLFEHWDANASVASIVVLLFGVPLLHPLHLAWLDSRFCNVVRLYAVDSSGTETQIVPRVFAPYHVIFDQGRFRYLTAEPMLVDTWGETESKETVSAVRSIKTLDDLHAVERKLGRSVHDERAALGFDRFVQAYISQRIPDTALVSVRVAKVHYDGSGFRLMEEREIRSISV